MAEELEATLLGLIGNGSVENTWTWAEESKVDHLAVVGTTKSLEAEGYAVSTPIYSEFWVLTAEADSYIAKGSPEAQCFAHIPADGADEAALKAALGDELVKIGIGKCMKNKWVSRDKATGKYTKLVSAIDRDELVEQLNDVRAGKADANLTKDLKKRQLISLEKRTAYKIEKGPNWAPVRRKLAADITKEMLDSGEWQTVPFKEYNFESAGKDVGGGHLHALMRVRAEFRQILLEMGFNEMPTNRYVESSFWNFDSLFQPQSHPARDAHDTFFLTTPATSSKVPEDYCARVQAMHETGGQGSGSIGYRYDWKRSEADKNLLRTHTTAVSARMLYKLANQPGGFKPAKYFSIDRVFRNEALDATHLAEFHQVEGVVADYNLSLGDLIGIITEFFRRIGITQLRFKPAYNPYTEPSMEVFGYHPDLKRCVRWW